MMGAMIARAVLIFLIARMCALAQDTFAPAPQQKTDDPWAHRPVCASLFLASEYRLSQKQRACDWIQNRLLSPAALAGAAAAATLSQFTERSSDRGKGTPGFTTRFSEDFAQSAAKSTGAYLGGLIFQEDPRRVPPYLVLRGGTPPHGFWSRTGHALIGNFISYRCVGELPSQTPGGKPQDICGAASQIRRVPALSRILGSLASGFSSELWQPDRLNSPGRALRRSASAYGATFGSSLFTEFKPDIARFGGKFFTAVFGVR